MPFRRVESAKIASAIVRQVETLILQGVLGPGDRLPAERDLARTLDVSRPTLREALAELEGRGLIVTRPGAGAYVAEVLGQAFSPALMDLFATHDEALFDYLEFRRDLEGLAAERAATRATETDRETIADLFRRMEAAHQRRSPAEEADLDARFHMSIVEAAHNVVMLHMMRSIFELLRRGVFYNRNALFQTKGARERLFEQHCAIRDQVLAGDAPGARAAVAAHLDFIEAHLREAGRLREREEIARLRRHRVRIHGERKKV